MVTAPALDPACTTGKGNSPPARKLASLPVWVSRLGSARICSRFFCFKALITAPKWMSGRNMNMFNRSLMVRSITKLSVAGPTVGTGMLGKGAARTPNLSLISTPSKLPNCWVVVLPEVFRAPVLKRLIPYWLNADRLTSANTTSNRISPLVGGASTSIRLITLGVEAETTSKILSAIASEDIRPESNTVSLDASIRTGSSGNTSLIFRDTSNMSRSTNRSKVWL